MSFSATAFYPVPVDEVWAWHTRPGAMSRLMPPFVPMTVRSASESLEHGTLVLHMPFVNTWTAQHSANGFEPQRHFTDKCETKAIARTVGWTHEHIMTPATACHTGVTGTLLTDLVTTKIPGKFLGRTFTYRQRQLGEDLAAAVRINQWATKPNDQGTPYVPLQGRTIALTGASGFVGGHLKNFLTVLGAKVVCLHRPGTPGDGDRLWDPANPAPDLLSGCDTLIHLAGSPIAGRFTQQHKQDVYHSRVEPTEKLAELVAATESVRTFISTSAIGFYGACRPDETLTEEALSGQDFLAHVCADWENACAVAANGNNSRVVIIRTGIVLGGDGGLLPVMRRIIATGLGGRLGDGLNFLSWISIDDLTDIYARAIVDEQLVGPVNATAPEPVRNRELTRAISRQVGRPAWIPTPAFAPKLFLGSEGASLSACADQKVMPAKLADNGHVFRYPTIEKALRHELGTETPLAPIPASEEHP